MGSGWSGDFSYGFYRLILWTIISKFELKLLCEAPQILNTIGQSKIILRHDVDVSLEKALKMAEIENELGICGTYMVIPDSPLYCLEEKSSVSIIRKLTRMGHEVALHFDLSRYNKNEEITHNFDMKVTEKQIHSSIKKMEDITQLPVMSISFHLPKFIPYYIKNNYRIIRGPLMFYGLVNAYSNKLMSWYLSDSRGRWIDGPPLPKLVKPDKPLLQLLIHPIWWGNKHLSSEDRLQEFFDTKTRGKPLQYGKDFDASLFKVTKVKRRGSSSDM